MNKRTIEIFSAGCPACTETIALVNSIICGSCTVEVLDMQNNDVAKRAKSLGVRSVPAVAVNGTLATCCATGGVDKSALREAGIGVPLT